MPFDSKWRPGRAARRATGRPMARCAAMAAAFVACTAIPPAAFGCAGDRARGAAGATLEPIDSRAPLAPRPLAAAAESVSTHIAQRDDVAAGAIVLEAADEHAGGLALVAASLEFVSGPSLPPGATQALLRTDPVTGGVERFIRFPAGLHIARHWHSSDETIVIVEGSATLSLERSVTAPATPTPLDGLAYCHIPARMIHEAWIGPAGALVYQRMSATPDRHAAPD